MKLASRLRFGVLSALIAAALPACTSSDEGFKPKSPQTKAVRRPDGSIDDHSLCEWRGRQDREASETAGPGSLTPNVRRVWQLIGTGEEHRKVLICREIDTNFDGIKDVVRRYNEAGESLHEEADSNYDGRIDTWITFAKGRLAEVKIDTNGDGNADEWKFYSEGKLARVRRDTNHDGKPDVWEIYHDGQLERMGVDLDGDERVDRWDHDNDLRRRIDEAERKKEEEAAAAAEKKQAAVREAAEKDNKEAGDEAGGEKKPDEKGADAEKAGEKTDDTKKPDEKAGDSKKPAPKVGDPKKPDPKAAGSKAAGAKKK